MMIIEIIIAILLGLLAGTITGITPGLHINLISATLLALTIPLTSIDIPLAIFIVSMSMTHTFVDFIPSVLFGAPDEDTFLSVLPGHEMLKEGKGYDAIVFSVYGSISGILIIILSSPILIFLIPRVFNILELTLPFLLIFISIYSILREKNIAQSFVLFMLAGILGMISFRIPANQPLLPLLTGLFGASALLISLKNREKIPKQEITPLSRIKPERKEFFKSFFTSILVAPVCSFLPGVGSGHAGFIGSELFKQSRKGFIMLVGAINTIVMGVSFVTLYTIQKARSGSAIAIGEILGNISFENLLLIGFVILISGILASFITLFLAKIMIKLIEKIDYNRISIVILIFLFIMVLIISNPLGLLLLLTATSLGIFAILSGIRRINLMGALLLPTIIYYLLS